jgi:hypothetical protein
MIECKVHSCRRQTAFGGLCVLGCYLSQEGVLGPLSDVQIDQKTLKHSPAQKLTDEEGERNDLRVGELLEGLVMLRFGIEDMVSVIYEAKQNYNRLLCLFQEGGLLGKLGLGHLTLLWTGNSDGPRLTCDYL